MNACINFVTKLLHKLLMQATVVFIQVEYHETVVGNWTGQQHSLYKSVHYTNSNQSVSEPDARQQAMYVWPL